MPRTKIKIGIVIPVHNCLDMTKDAVKSMDTKHAKEIVIVDDNSRQDMKDWLNSEPTLHKIIDPAGSTGLAFNWNLGIRKMFELGCKYVLVSNNDVVLHPQTIDLLVARMERGGAVMATAANLAQNYPTPQDLRNDDLSQFEGQEEQEHPDFSCFMISQETIDKVGWFDENFIRGYYEDNDYHARIALANERAVKVPNAIYYHYASQTITQNPQDAGAIHSASAGNSGYFTRKWGRPPLGNVDQMRMYYYKNPFNDASKSVKEW